MSDYINQIDEPKIKLDPIEFQAPDNKEDITNITKGLGFVPFLWYMGFQVRETNIQFLRLYHDGILPKLR